MRKGMISSLLIALLWSTMICGSAIAAEPTVAPRFETGIHELIRSWFEDLVEGWVSADQPPENTSEPTTATAPNGASQSSGAQFVTPTDPTPTTGDDPNLTLPEDHDLPLHLSFPLIDPGG